MEGSIKNGLASGNLRYLKGLVTNWAICRFERLINLICTFVMMHIDAMPAKYVTTLSHLRGLEILFQTDGTIKLFARMISDLPNLLPLLLFNALERWQSLNFIVRKGARVNGESESSHKRLLAILDSVS